MKRTPLLALLAVAFLALSPLALGSVSAAPDTVLEGIVIHNSSPFEGATIELRLQADDSLVTQALSGADGRFTMAAGDGSYYLQLATEGYEISSPMNTNFVVSGEASIDLEEELNSKIYLVEVTTAVSGVVTSDGAPVGGALVSVLHGVESLGSTSSLADGTYALMVRSGNHVLRVERDGFAVHEEEIDAPASGTLTVNVVLTPLSSHSLSGKVVTGQGAPLAGCAVTLTRVTGLANPLTYETHSAADGRFSFPAVLDGDYGMLVTRDGYTELLNVYSSISIGENLALEHLIVMTEAYGGISGKVFNGSFMISNALLILLDAEGKELQNTVSVTEGVYQFLNVPTGSYTLKVVRNGYEDAQSEVVVLASETVVADFELANIDRLYLFGLDMPHSMMAIGVGLAALVMLLTFSFRLRVDREPEILYLRTLEEDEEEL